MGLPGWVRFGFSLGWLGRSPSGLPPTAQWLLQSGLLPQYLAQIQPQISKTTQTLEKSLIFTPISFGLPFSPVYSKEQERMMLEQQLEILESQLEVIRKRLDELRREEIAK
ncbi:MAG: DUF5320 domain-containing protein [Candidatus Bathyarchaeia archaeon]